MKRVVAIAFACLVAACSATSPADVRLVSRSGAVDGQGCDAESCAWSFSEMPFRDERGGTATLDASVRASRFDLSGMLDAVCGGSTHPRQLYSGLHRFEDPEGQSSMLRFDDGSVVRLVPDEAVTFSERCYEETGRWEGVDGGFEGRRGIYVFLWDQLQTDLTLTESPADAS